MIQCSDWLPWERRHLCRRVVSTLRVTFLLACVANLGTISVRTAAPVTNRPAEPPALFSVRPFDLLMPFSQPPRFEPISFPATDPMGVIARLALTDGRLWISARPRGETNLKAGEGRLWTFSPLQNRIEPILGALAYDATRDIRARSDGVWTAVEGGVVVLDPQTFVFDPFSAPQGITTRQLVGFATAAKRLLALGESGDLFELKPDGRTWRRVDPPAPAINPREPVRWRRTAGSGDWVLALGASGAEIAYRHLEAPQWVQAREESLVAIPRAAPPAWTAVVGDQGSGFWLGSDLGLHLLLAETGSIEHHVAPARMTIAGGWGRTFGPHFKPSPALWAQIISRQTDEIRQRMRDRARLARVAKELRIPLDAITPVSRVPGAVRAMTEDGSFIWVATEDPLAPERSRVLLLHAASRKWLGWFSVARPVTALAADASHLYLGLDVDSLPNGIPLLRVAKAPFVTVPEIRRVPDAVTAAELGPKLAALPVRERATFAFFSGDHQTVVDLLSNSPQPDAESLFLLAFAHDPVGLDQSTKHEAYLDTLITGYPESPLALATAGLRQVRVATFNATPPESTSTTPPSNPPAADSAAAILTRRDLNRDGKINLIEFRLWRGPTADVQPFDANGDRQLDLTELEVLLRK